MNRNALGIAKKKRGKMKKELKTILVTVTMFYIAGGLFGPLYAVFVENIGGNLVTAGVAYSIFAIASGILMFILGKWEDSIKHQEKLVLIGHCISSIGYLGYLFVSQPWHLFIVQGILGIGLAVAIPANDGLYSKYLDKGKFASEWGIWDALVYITVGIGALIGGFIANAYGFKTLFFIMFFLSLGGVIASVYLTLLHHRKQMKELKKIENFVLFRKENNEVDLKIHNKTI